MEIFIIFKLLISILIFGALFIAGKLICKKIDGSENRALDSLEYFPEEEFQTITQFFYLIMMLIFFIFILYIIVVEGNDFVGIAVLQMTVSLYIALILDYSSWNKIFFFLLVPYELLQSLFLMMLLEYGQYMQCILLFMPI